MTTYASRTKVSPVKTREEVTGTLRRFGASDFRYYEDETRATIGFTAQNLKVAISIPIEGKTQEVASRWRTLGLAIKAKLALIECGGSTFEREFFADLLLPSGETVHEIYQRDPDVQVALRGGIIEAKVIELPTRASS